MMVCTCGAMECNSSEHLPENRDKAARGKLDFSSAGNSW